MFRCFPRLVAGLCVVSLACLPGAVWAGISGTTNWEVQTGGSDTANGGGFDPASASMATNLAATSATGTAPVVTSASYNFAARDVGAWLFIKSGTNWIPGWYRIVSVASNAATLTATIGSAPLWVGGTDSGTNTVAGCATTASPTGGTWSIDYSQSASPGIVYTDMAVGGTNTQYTSALNPVGPNVVGNIISVTSGTGFTVQRVQIASVSGTTATVDKTLGGTSLTGGNGGMGGALATIAKTYTLASTGVIVWVKSGTYALSAAMDLRASAPTYLFGYSVTRGDDVFACAILTCNFSSGAAIRTSATSLVKNIEVAKGSGTTVRGFWAEQGCIYYQCKATNCDDMGFYSNFTGPQYYYSCWASGCTSSTSGAFFANILSHYVGCVATSSGATSGFLSTAACTYIDCVSDGTTGPNHGISTVAGSLVHGCWARANANAGADGIYMNGIIAGVSNSIAIGSGRDGIHVLAFTSGTSLVLNCATFGNGAGVGGGTMTRGLVALSGDPSVNSASGNYAPNNTAGTGAACRAAGFPAKLGNQLTASYPDIGPAQSSASGGSGTGPGKKAGPGGGKVGLISPPIRLRKAG